MRCKTNIIIDDKINSITLRAGIDTIQIRTTAPITFTEADFPYLYGKSGTDSQHKYYYYRINPNKSCGSLIDSYADYRQTVKDCIDRIPHDNSDITITRVDYRFDNYNDDYRDYLKLNTALLLLFGEEYKVRNAYHSRHLQRIKDLSAIVNGSTFSAEYYDKAQQRMNNDDVDDVDAGVLSRLELRTRKLHRFKDAPALPTFDVAYQLETEYSEFYRWVQRINKSVTYSNLDSVTHKLNLALAEVYPDWLQRYGKGYQLSTFLCENRNALITKAQIIELYEMLDISNAKTKVRDLLRNHTGIETVDMTNIDLYCSKLIDAAEDFFIN